MATLILSTVGTVLGGPIGGAIGSLIGQQIDMAIIGSPTRKGPRLKELSVQTSSYGAPIPRLYGRMRVAGSVIWATELRESREKSGGGKGKPKVVTYTYSASFAVALASRPIRRVGRIWADGNLLRGAADDLKAGGELRIHTGQGDQACDPLIAAAEGPTRCPAFRGMAYAVFENLALADFGNRIPSLTFEVFADDGSVTLTQILRDAIPGVAVSGTADGVLGYSVESGSMAALVEAIGEAVPLACTSQGQTLTLKPVLGDTQLPFVLPEALAVSDGPDGAPRAGLSHRRERKAVRLDAAVRYYDVDRDYQPGLQRARGQSFAGQPSTLDFPAALDAAGARTYADRTAHEAARPREIASYRVGQADLRSAPGRQVVVPGLAGRWLVESWEFDGTGIELGLGRHAGSSRTITGAADPGRANLPSDRAAQPTRLAAFELPWDGIGASGAISLFAAASAAGSGWSGAALFVVRPDGSLIPLGGTGRNRATLGTALAPLAPAAPLVLDWLNAVEIELVAPDLALAGASLAQLATGANRALLGRELIQFARVQSLGQSRWRLTGLLRGRGGTEWAIPGHGPGESFVLLDDTLVPLDPATVGDTAYARIAATGLADAEPVIAAIALPGASLRPLSPVHGTLEARNDGSLELRWIRRARGAWLWLDGVDTPLVEQAESYLVTLGPAAAPIAQWIAAEPLLRIDAASGATLRTMAPGALFAVAQRGDAGLSPALLLGTLN
ncbi:MAG: phage tail protein [Novosphingobium sp.]|nr:phage tail protein [Novosphingobium sp.]